MWPIEGSLTGTTTLCQSGTGSNGNDGVLYIPQSSRTGAHIQMQFKIIFRTLVARKSYPSTEMESVYSKAPTDWSL